MMVVIGMFNAGALGVCLANKWWLGVGIFGATTAASAAALMIDEIGR